jgi:hypothetical protein
MRHYILIWCASLSVIPQCSAAELNWAGTGSHRIVVSVEPTPNAGPRADELVASTSLDLYGQFPSASKNHRIDLHSLQMIRQDIAEEVYPKHAQQRAKADRPFRFYDGGLADEFPTWKRYASLEKLGGRPVFQMRDKLPFGHRVFGSVGNHVKGTLVWPHTQTGKQASTYGIYFNLEPDKNPPNSPPIGWIGDGGNRFAPKSPLNGPPGNNNATAIDWNADGLPDLLYGLSSGYVIIAENTGTHEQPEFNRRRIIHTSDGKPIDVGYDASPLSVDWNGDSVRDLLIGAEKGCVLYFQNLRSNADPSFEFKGFIEADGKMLLTPNWPIAELPNGKPGEVYHADYLAIPCVCDWDGDGDQDLLAGGFVTGWLFYFENIGNGPDGTPTLSARGPLQVDGKPIDTGWAAAPTAVDLDHDGDLDLVCGAKPMTADGGDTSDRSGNLLYFENVGTRTKPELKRRPVPGTGLPPTGTTIMGPVCDWNGDNLPDLFLVTRGSMLVYPIANIGSRERPVFQMKSRPTITRWNHQQIPAGTFADWNHDGHPDVINRFSVMLNDGVGFPHTFTKRFSILAGKKPIRHPNPHGDENSYVTLHDLDSDGDHDCIYGAHSGHIWFHENSGTDEKPDLDIEGYRLPLSNGDLMRVGESPPDKQGGFNFTDLQGARPKPAAADFDQDGRVDLVIGDTYGRVRLFRNEGTTFAGRHVFSKPITILDSPSRLSLHAGDWDGDKAPDIFVVTGQRVNLYRNKSEPGRSTFEEPQRLKLPPSIGGFYGVAPVDLNGDGDGDTDLVYQTSSRITCWVERSFLEHGYRPAVLIDAGAREK